MSNQLGMAMSETIVTLHGLGWSKRRIARQLGVDRGTVCRHIQAADECASEVNAAKKSKAASLSEVTTGFSAALDSKQATSDKVTTGSETPSVTPTLPVVSVGRSACEPFREIVGAKLDAGLSAQRIHQDLTAEHGFTGGYESVKRMVRRLSAGQDPPFRRMECAAGAEAQIDFGSGGSIVDAHGKRRRSHVLRLVLSHSRKGYSESVLRQTTDDFLACVENAFWDWGGVPRTLVVDNLKAAVT